MARETARTGTVRPCARRLTKRATGPEEPTPAEGAAMGGSEALMAGLFRLNAAHLMRAVAHRRRETGKGQGCDAKGGGCPARPAAVRWAGDRPARRGEDGGRGRSGHLPPMSRFSTTIRSAFSRLLSGVNADCLRGAPASQIGRSHQRLVIPGLTRDPFQIVEAEAAVAGKRPFCNDQAGRAQRHGSRVKPGMTKLKRSRVIVQAVKDGAIPAFLSPASSPPPSARNRSGCPTRRRACRRSASRPSPCRRRASRFRPPP